MLLTEVTAGKSRLVLIGVNPGRLIHELWRYNGAMLPPVGFSENLLLDHTTLVSQIWQLQCGFDGCVWPD